MEKTQSDIIMNAALNQLSINTKDLWTPKSVPRVSESMDSMTFLREYVSLNSPVVFTNAMKTWKCMRLWSLKYLANSCGSIPISVNITPDGKADAIKPCYEANGSRIFVAPEERKMTLEQFCNYMKNPESLDGIPYLSRQNDNLNEEFASLLQDVPSFVPFARDAFGTDPEAVNLWIGDSRSVSSCHQDFYENIYCVLRGTKIFTLYPPSDAAFLKEKPFRKGKHRYQSSVSGSNNNNNNNNSSHVDKLEIEGSWCVDMDQDEVINWIDEEEAVSLASPVVVEVKAGEILYLPALWYHSVAQSDITIAVNFWHDMRFSHMYVMSQFIRSLHVELPTMEGVITRELLERSKQTSCSYESEEATPCHGEVEVQIDTEQTSTATKEAEPSE